MIVGRTAKPLTAATVAVNENGEIVERNLDAVVGDAVLREIVGANFFGAITGLDLAAALRSQSRVLLFLLHFVETGAEDAHGLGAILDLRFLVLLRDNEAAGNVGFDRMV